MQPKLQPQNDLDKNIVHSGVVCQGSKTYKL